MGGGFKKIWDHKGIMSPVTREPLFYNDMYTQHAAVKFYLSV